MTDLVADERASRRWRRFEAGVLAAAFVLRLWIALRGGQGYWRDEDRFGTATIALRDFGQGQVKAGWAYLLGGGDHVLFKILCLPAAALDEAIGTSLARDACYLGLFSVAALALIGSCARAAGGSVREGALAVFFAALAASLFYYARHLFPYDLSLCLCLVALRLGLGSTASGRVFLAGAFAGLGFLAYEGYWLLGGLILIFVVVRVRPWGALVRVALTAASGLAASILLAALAARLVGVDLIGQLRSFSGTITQGDFGRGYAFVWAYLWSAEGLMLAVWLAACGYAAIRAFRTPGSARPIGWLALLVGLYGLLCLGSDLVHAFVVYGRTARILTPFFCLLAAWAVDDLWTRGDWAPRSRHLMLGGLALIAAYQFWAPMSQVFPARFIDLAGRHAEGSGPTLERLLNANSLADNGYSADRQPRTVLFARRHPLQYGPYLFEGMTGAQRADLRGKDIGMKLVAMSNVPVPAHAAGWPGALRCKVTFPVGREREGEPLLASGDALHHDALFVRYIDRDHLRFAYESVGHGSLVSDLIAVDPRREHDLVLFVGAMLAPDADAARSDRLRRTVLAVLDGRIVLAGQVGGNGAASGRLFLGMDLVRPAPAGEAFTGEIRAVEPVSAAVLRSLLPLVDLTALAPGAGDHPGPLVLHLILPTDRSSGTEPLVSTGGRGHSSGLALSYLPDGRGQLSLVNSNEPSVLSAPFRIPPDGRVEVTVALPALGQGNGGRTGPSAPPVILRERVWARVNGQTVLSTRRWSASSEASDLQLLSNDGRVDGVGGYFTGRVERVELGDGDEIAREMTVSPEVGFPGRPLAGYCGPVALTVRIADGPVGLSEPLVTTGTTGAADFVFLRHLGGRRVVVGVDHWGSAGSVSDPIDLGAIDRVHSIVVSLGSLFPDRSNALYARHPAWPSLRRWLVVIVDSKVVLKVPLLAYPSTPDQVGLARNEVGGSSAVPFFRGTVLGTDFTSPDVVLAGTGPLP